MLKRIIAIALLALTILACGGGSSQERLTIADQEAAVATRSAEWAAERTQATATARAERAKATPTPAVRVTPYVSTRPASSVNSMVTSSIEANLEVVDSAILRQGQQVSLVLIVRSATNTSRARHLGENFVRMYKSMSDDDTPGSTIGRGKYDYIVGVYYPNKKPVATGAKASIADRMSWS